jgi:hypothetical protein
MGKNERWFDIDYHDKVEISGDTVSIKMGQKEIHNLLIDFKEFLGEKKFNELIKKVTGYIIFEI